MVQELSLSKRTIVNTGILEARASRVGLGQASDQASSLSNWKRHYALDRKCQKPWQGVIMYSAGHAGEFRRVVFFAMGAENEQ